MADDDLLVEGVELEAADLRVESDSGNRLSLGFALLGIACWLAGPLWALAALPADLSKASASTFAVAVEPMAVGFGLVFIAGILAIFRSDPVVAALERIGDWHRSDPEPLTDGGDPDE
jgi:hypothetical protein